MLFGRIESGELTKNSNMSLFFTQDFDKKMSLLADYLFLVDQNEALNIGYSHHNRTC